MDGDRETSSNDEQGLDSGRRDERLALDAEARLRPNDWSSLQVTMVDLSTSGFRAECEARVKPGSGVSLDVPGIGAVEAQVEWQRDTHFGARFLQPIDLAQCQWALSDRRPTLACLLVIGRQRARRRAEARSRRETLPMPPIRKAAGPA